MLVVLMSTLLIGALANNPKDDAQFMNLNVKTVKGSYGGYRGGDNLNRFFNNTSHGYVQANQNHEVGVCYIEVPTSSLGRDPKHIPAGNGQKTKWHTSSDTLQTGTLVPVKDRGLPPLLWLLGRVTKVYPVTDNVTWLCRRAAQSF